MGKLEWPGIIAITSTSVAFLLMALDWVGPDICFTVLLAWLTAFGYQAQFVLNKPPPSNFSDFITTVSRSSAGYGNSGLLTVVFLYWVAEGVTQTGGLEVVMNYVLGRSRSVHWALVRSMLPVMFLSAFLNNTPCVSFMIPILLSWSRRCGVPPKKLLIPLSYAAVLGGTCTSIGTSTNLVVVGLQDTRYTRAKQPQNAKFNMFDIAPYGVPYALWGFIFVVATQRFLLPGNSSKYAKDLLLAVRVLPTSSVVKKSLKDSGLRGQHGFSIEAVLRDGSLIRDIDHNFVLLGNDIIYVAGELDVVEFVGEEYGLGLVTQEQEEGAARLPGSDSESTAFSGTGAAPYKKLVQVTIPKTSDLIGRTVREVQWQGRFGLIPVGIERGKDREDGRLSDVVLAPEDVLILDTTSAFTEENEEFKANFGKLRYIKDGAAKEFVIGVKVKKSAEVVDKTVSSAGLRGIPGLFVLSVERADGTSVDATDYLYKIQPEDTIWLAADTSAVDFLGKFPGLVLVQQEQVEKTRTSILHRHLVQAAVAHKGELVGKTLRDVRFRSIYHAAVVAVHREGARVPLKVQDIVLQGGDVLLLSCHVNWAEQHRHDKSFVLLQAVPNSSPRKGGIRMIISGLLVLGMVLTQIVGGIKNKEMGGRLMPMCPCIFVNGVGGGFAHVDRVALLAFPCFSLYLPTAAPQYIHLFPGSVLTAGLMLLTGCMSGDQARRAIMWDVYLTIAGAFGVSAALEGTGVAAEFANAIIRIGRDIGSTGAALEAIYIATALMSELLTNNAAGAIMYPIAAIAGDALKIDPKDVSIAIMLGASAGFVNPFSYQTNMMVFGAGNYSMREFAIIGAPFQVYLMIVAAFILCYRNQWHQVWIVSWVATAVFVILPALWLLLPIKFQESFDAKVEALFAACNPRRAVRRVRSKTFSRQGSATKASASLKDRSDSDDPSPRPVPKLVA